MGLSQLQQELTALRTYFNTKKSELDAALSAALAAAPTTERNFYVDAVDGLDMNPGTSAAPFKTVDKALLTAPSGLLSNIWMRAAQVHQLGNDRELRYSAVRFRRWGSEGVNPVLTPLVTSDGTYNVSRCIGMSGGHALLTEVDVTMSPKVDAGLPWRGFNGLFVAYARDSLGGSSVKMSGQNGSPATRAKLTLVPGQGLARSLAGIVGIDLSGVETINSAGGATTAHVAMGGGHNGPLALGIYDLILGAGTKLTDGIASHPDGYKSLITNYTAASGLI